MIAYRATHDVPRELASPPRSCWPPSGAAAAPARQPGASCFWQAVLGLRWFRDRTSPEALARDHQTGRATACRHVDEGIDVLAAEAPDLHEALDRARGDGLPRVILDGTMIESDRCREPVISAKGEVIDLWYSGKAHGHGGSVQAVAAPGGLPLWTSDAEPGSVHDITAARAHALPALYRAAAAGLPTLAGPDTKAPGSASASPSGTPQTAGTPISIHAPITRSSGRLAAWASAGSPCSPAAGAPSITSPPARARSETSSAPQPHCP